MADILNNYERISDHCFNRAIAVIQADSDTYDLHEYIKNLHTNDDMQYERLYNIDREKYMG